MVTSRRAGGSNKSLATLNSNLTKRTLTALPYFCLYQRVVNEPITCGSVFIVHQALEARYALRGLTFV